MPAKMENGEEVYRTRSLGVAAPGIPDQYADGSAAKVWTKYVGDEQQRTGYYRNRLLSILRQQNCKTIFDVACGTGIDSIFLLEEGFEVASCDASDKMLKYALKTRWARRREPAFDRWVIEEGNWLNLEESEVEPPKGGFDALICMGNSFAHLPDFDGQQTNHLTAIQNFYSMLKPGGILVIDHRNYDHIIAGGTPPMKNIYYQSKAKVDVKTSVLKVDGKYQMVTLDYVMYPSDDEEDHDDISDIRPVKKRKPIVNETNPDSSKFRLSYYPHLLENFNKLITKVFGEDSKHTILADFEPLDAVDNPAYYIHVCQKN